MKENNDLAGSALKSLAKNYSMIGKHHIRGWHAWLVVGVISGLFAGLVILAFMGVENFMSQAAPPDKCSPWPECKDGGGGGGGTTTLEAPSLLSPQNGSTLTLSPILYWSQVSDAQYYRVEVTTSTDTSFINPAIRTTTDSTSYTTQALSGNSSYIWRVRGEKKGKRGIVDAGPWSQSYSFTLSGTTQDTETPLAPGLSGVAVSSSQINLSWSASSDNVGVQGYRVYQNNTQIATTSLTSYSATELSPSTQYSYYVRAYDAAGNVSLASNTVYLTTDAVEDTQAPLAPSNLSAQAVSSSQINLSWSASSDNVGVQGYRVYRNNSHIATTTSTSYSNTPLSPSTTYSYYVRAYDAAGNVSGNSNTVSATTENEQPPPSGGEAPDTKGTWVSPEGVTFEVTTAGDYTIRDAYTLLVESAMDLDIIGPNLLVKIQDTYSSQTAAGFSGTGDRFNFSAIIYLKGVDRDTFTFFPNQVVAHEYGHAWATYWRGKTQNGAYDNYLNARNLAGDSRLGSSYSWGVYEIIADDYRLLFGSQAAIDQKPWHMNNDIPHPSDVPGLKEFLLGSWRGL